MLFRSWQLPDIYEPNPWSLLGPDGEPRIAPTALGYEDFEQLEIINYLTMDMLMDLGVPDTFQKLPRDDTSSIQSSLLMMNHDGVNWWYLEQDYSPFLVELRARVTNQQLDAGGAVEALFNRILIRPPTAAERDLFTAYLNGRPLQRALADMTWTLLNHPDFLYRR